MGAAAGWIGLAVAKAWLDGADGGEGRPGRVATDAAGIAAPVAALTTQAPQRIGLEPTGGLETDVTAARRAAGRPVAVVNPARGRAFAQASGQAAKTDGLDARLLARVGARRRPPARALPDEMTQELRGRLARRRQVVEMPTMEVHRPPTPLASLRSHVEAHPTDLETARAALDAMPAPTIQASPAWQAKETVLRSIPGIGPVVARPLLAELPELGTLNRQEAAALAGVAPINRDSGTSHRPRGIGGGRSGVRARLDVAAPTATRRDPAMRAPSERLVGRGQPATAALVACPRTLLGIATAVRRDGVAWRPPGGAAACHRTTVAPASE